MNSMYIKIIENYPKLTAAERMVIDFILSHDEVGNLKLKQIREKLFVSNATIVRACKKLQYATFNELKYTVAHCKRSERSDIHQSDYARIINKLQKETIDILTKLNENKINYLCTCLVNAKKVLCVGSDAWCMAVATEFYGKLTKMGFQAKVCSEWSVVDHLSRINENQDVIILFASTVDFCQNIYQKIIEADKSGLKVIVITDQEEIVVQTDTFFYLKVKTNKTLGMNCEKLTFAMISILFCELLKL